MRYFYFRKNRVRRRAVHHIAMYVWGAGSWALLAHAVAQEKSPRLEDLVRTEVSVVAGSAVFGGVVTAADKVTTLCHRLAGTSSYEVQSIDGRRHPARLVAADQDRNVCILQADDLPARVADIANAQSSEQTRVARVLHNKDGQYRLGELQVIYQGRVLDGTYLGLKASILSSESFIVRDGAGVYDWQGRLVGMASVDTSGPSSLTMALPVEWMAHVAAKMPPPELPLTITAWMNQARAIEARGSREGLLRNNLHWIEDRPQSAWAWSNLGNAYMFSKEADKLSRGIAAYQRAVELDPRLAGAWSNLGNAYLEAGDTARAIDAYRNATRIDRADSVGWGNLANLYIKTNRPSEAMSTLKLAASAGKGQSRAKALNDLAGMQTDPHEAAEMLRLAVAETPGDSVLWNNLGTALQKTGDQDKAIRAYEVAVHAGPGNLAPWVNLGIAHWNAKQPELALKAFRMATAIDPKSGFAWKWQGILLTSHERDYRRAIAAFLEASTHGENGADLWSDLGVSYKLDGQLEKAEEAYGKAIEREPKAALHRVRLSELYLAQERLTDASQVAEEAIGLNPLEAMSWDTLGNMRRHQGQWPQAAAAYRKATELDPKVATTWINLGTALNEIGELAEAKEVSKQALRIDPGNLAAQTTLGVSYIRSKEFAPAVDLFERLNRENPNDALVLANLTSAYRRAGKAEEALNTYARLQKLDVGLAQRVYDLELKAQP